MILEPRWKSYIVTSNGPIFTKEQCNAIIRLGLSLPREKGLVGIGGIDNNDQSKLKPDGINDDKKRITKISWIPFNNPEAQPMYSLINSWIQNININHFGFDGIQITEQAQFTEYPKGAFYEWHTDSDTHFVKQPPVRKISMTCLLSDENDFEGGDLEIIDEASRPKMKQGHAIFFASFLRHRVTPVTKGNRKSLVMWFGGPPLK